MQEQFAYCLTSGWNTGEHSGKRKFETDKEAWNFLAKRLDARYKTGHHVVVTLYRIQNVQFIHPQRGNPNITLSREGTAADVYEEHIPVLAGYKLYDFDGNPWNNPHLCFICKAEISRKQYDDHGVCEKCMTQDGKS